MSIPSLFPYMYMYLYPFFPSSLSSPSPKTTISQLFAIMRQWIPQTQGHLTLLTREASTSAVHVHVH